MSTFQHYLSTWAGVLLTKTEGGVSMPRKDPVWRSVTVRVKEEDLIALKNKLSLNGYNTLNEFVHAWINGRYPSYRKDDQIERLLLIFRNKGITDPLKGDFNPTFWRNIDVSDMLNDLSQRYIYKKHARDLVHYFQRFVEIFFTKPQIIRTETGHKRAWICDAMRRFGEYYDRKFHNPELKLLINEIINRFELNKKMRIHDRLWITDDNFLINNIKTVLQIQGDLGTIVRIALFSGLRGEEISHIHRTQVCQTTGRCNRENLHVVNKSNGLSVILINRVVGNKHSYFSILPTHLWSKFRDMSRVEHQERKALHCYLMSVSKGQISLMSLRKYHYNVLARSELKEIGADVLAGRAKSISAKHYLINELDLMTQHYRNAWTKYVPLKVLCTV